jgi:Antibiotic biosynthesis monooxygenase
MKSHVIEIVTFKVTEGTSLEALEKAAAAANTFIRNRPGFVARRLSRSEDGTFLEHVEWQTMSDAKAATAAIGSDPGVVPFMAMIDPATVTMGHNTLIVSLD